MSPLELLSFPACTISINVSTDFINSLPALNLANGQFVVATRMVLRMTIQTQGDLLGCVLFFLLFLLFSPIFPSSIKVFLFMSTFFYALPLKSFIQQMTSGHMIELKITFGFTSHPIISTRLLMGQFALESFTFHIYPPGLET